MGPPPRTTYCTRCVRRRDRCTVTRSNPCSALGQLAGVWPRGETRVRQPLREGLTCEGVREPHAVERRDVLNGFAPALVDLLHRIVVRKRPGTEAPGDVS